MSVSEAEAGIPGILRRLVSADGLEIGEREGILFETYARLLRTWNERINLTAILGDRDIAVKHFQDSLAVLPRIRPYLTAGCRSAMGEGKIRIQAADVGTGAGFPGIPLKIMSEDMDWVLIDSLEKRTVFLREVAKALGLEKEIQIMHMRAEEAGRDPRLRDRMDLVLARAVAPMPVLAEYCLPLVREGGLFVAMKGPDPEAETEEAKKAVHCLAGRIEGVERYVIGGTAAREDTAYGRSLVMVRKTGPTPAGYPRRAGVPSGKPIR